MLPRGASFDNEIVRVRPRVASNLPGTPISRQYRGLFKYPRQDSNTHGKCPEKPHLSSERGTKSGTVGDDLANLVDLLKAWPDLPAAVRAGILAMVRAAEGGA